MAIRSRRRTRLAVRRSLTRNDTSSSESSTTQTLPAHEEYNIDNQEVAKWGIRLILFSWFIFLAGVGGVLGIWDRALGYTDNRIVDLACYFSLIVVTGFAWTVLNW